MACPAKHVVLAVAPEECYRGERLPHGASFYCEPPHFGVWSFHFLLTGRLVLVPFSRRYSMLMGRMVAGQTHQWDRSMKIGNLFAQWRVLNEQASEAEQRIFEATMQYVRGSGPAPSDIDRGKAAQLRQEARRVFALALAEADATAEAARKSIIRSDQASQQASARGSSQGPSASK